MNFLDTVSISGTRRREDGVLLVDARTARTGIQIYQGFEVGRADLQSVRVFRSADEVFSEKTLKSFAHRPVTNDHPAKMVDSSNWRQVAVGQSADEVTASDIYVRVPLMVSDEDAIRDIEAGKRELSAGYYCDLDWTAGTTKAGDAYDAKQINIKANHIAIVKKGRAGPECRIGDAWSDTNPIEDDHTMTTKLMTVDGIPISVTDQAEAVINNLTRRLADEAAKISTLTATHTAALATKDAEIGRLTAEVATAKAAIPTVDAMRKMATDRVALETVAAKIVKDFNPAGLSDADIRKKVVVAKHGEAIIAGMNDDAIGGMFVAVTKDLASAPVTPTDPFRSAALDTNRVPTVPVVDKDAAYTKMTARLSNAWKGAGGTA